MSVPPCDTLPPDTPVVDCALEGQGPALFFDYDIAADGPGAGTVILDQSTAEGGARRASDPLPILGSDVAPPGFRDLDLDGTNELLLPLGTIAGATDFAVWRLGSDGFFAPIGRIGGTTIAAFDIRGALLVGVVPDPAGGATETGYIVDIDGILELYALAVDPVERRCTVIAPRTAEGLNTGLLVAECEARDWETEAAQAAATGEEETE